MSLSYRNSSGILFLVSPLLYLIHAVKRFDNESFSKAVWLFVIYYGATFAVGVESKGQDILEYFELTKFFANEINSVSEGLSYYMKLGDIDFVRYLLAFIISRVSINFQFMVICFAFIYGYFFSKALKEVYGRFSRSSSGLNILLITAIVLIIPIWSINGFRFWCASLVYLCGLFGFFWNKSNRSLLLMSSCIFFHFALLAPVLMVFIFIALPKRLDLYFGVFILSLFYNQFDLQEVSSIFSSFAPDQFVSRTSGYLNVERAEFLQKMETEVNWYAVWYLEALKWSSVILTISTYLLNRKTLISSPFLRPLFALSLLISSFALFVYNIPSGQRFIYISAYLLFSTYINLSQNIEFKVPGKIIRSVVAVMLLLFITVSVRMGLYSISVNTILGNPIVALFTMNHNMAINDVLK